MNDTTTAQVSIDIGARNLVIDKIANALSNDAGFVAELTEYGTRKDQNAVSSIVLALHVMHRVDPQTVMSAPVSGSEAVTYDPKDKKKVTGINNNPDYYKTTDATGNVIETRFYREVLIKLPPGKACWDDLTLLRQSKGLPTVEDGKTDANPYRNLGDDDRKKRIAARASKMTALIGACAEAFEIAQAIKRANDIDGVEVEIEVEPNQPFVPVSGTYSPIIVSDCSGKTAAHRKRTRSLGANGFLSLRPEIVPDKVSKLKPEEIANGGAWMAFVNSMKPREKKGDGQTPGTVAAGGSKYPPITGIDTFHDWATTGTNFLDADGDNVKNEAKVLKWLGDANTGDDIVLAVGDVCMSFDSMFNVIQARYRKLADQRQRAKEMAKNAA